MNIKVAHTYQIGFQTPANILAENISAFHDDLRIFLTGILSFGRYVRYACFVRFAIKNNTTGTMTPIMGLFIIYYFVCSFIFVGIDKGEYNPVPVPAPIPGRTVPIIPPLVFPEDINIPGVDLPPLAPRVGEHLPLPRITPRPTRGQVPQVVPVPRLGDRDAAGERSKILEDFLKNHKLNQDKLKKATGGNPNNPNNPNNPILKIIETILLVAGVGVVFYMALRKSRY